MFPKKFCFVARPKQMNKSFRFPLTKELSLYPILATNTFVAKTWCRNLKLKSINLVLLVQFLARVYALCQFIVSFREDFAPFLLTWIFFLLFVSTNV